MKNRILAVLAVSLFVNLLSYAQPNVVIFYADDLGWGDLSVNNKRAEYFRHTPNIDRMFNQGIRLDNYITHCVCSPSRAGLLTGKHFAEVVSGPGVNGELPYDDNTRTFAEDFQFHGYKTGYFGKWHNSNPGRPAEGFGQEVADYDTEMIPRNNIFEYPSDYNFGIGVNGYGFDRFVGYYGGGGDLFDRVDGPYGGYQLYWWHDDKPNNEAGYTTELITKYANEFIEANQSGPFCAYIPHQAVHNPLHIKQSDLRELCNQFPGEWNYIKGIKSKNGSKTIQQVDNIRCAVGEEFDYTAVDGGSERFKNLVFATYIYALDKSVGQVVQKVTDLGLFNETIFVFSSDNGALPQGSALPYSGGKHSLLEGGVRVPTAIWWPGTFDNNTAPYSPGNNRYNGLVGYIDMYPTLMAMAGLECKGVDLDGLNVWPNLQANSEARPGYENPYFDMWRDHGTVRTTKWKLFYAEAGNRVELYNLHNDTKEANNLASNNATVKNDLINLYKSWIRQNNYAVPYMRVPAANISHPNPAPSGDYLEIEAVQNNATNAGVYVRYATGTWDRDKLGHVTEPGDRLEYDIFVPNNSDKTKGFYHCPGDGWTPMYKSTNGVNQDGKLMVNLTMPKGKWVRYIVGIGTNAPTPTAVHYIALTGSGTGTYRFYLDNVVVRKKNGDIRTVIWRSRGDDVNLLYRYKNKNYNTLADAKAVNGFPFQSIKVNTRTFADNDARFVSIDAPAQVEAGSAFTATIRYENSGTKNWGTATYKLGSQNPADNQTWGLSRVGLNSSVSMNGFYDFQINATAPLAGGNYSFRWKLLEEGVEWFGELSGAHSIFVSTSPGTNLLVNRSFENGVPTPNSWALSGSGLVSVSTDTAHDQSNSLMLSSVAAAQIAPTTQTINNLKANTGYQVRAWVLNPGQTAGRLIVDMNDKPTAVEDLQFLIDPGDAPVWTEYSGVWNSGSDTSVTIRIFTNAEFSGTAYVDFLEFYELPDDPYIQWKADNGITDDNGDKDNDGIANLMEYALGTDPGLETAAQRPAVSRTATDFEFRFKRERSSLTYTIEKSSDLINWSDHATVNDSHGPVGSDAIVPVSVSEMGGGKLFLRLKVEN